MVHNFQESYIAGGKPPLQSPGTARMHEWGPLIIFRGMRKLRTKELAYTIETKRSWPECFSLLRKMLVRIPEAMNMSKQRYYTGRLDEQGFEIYFKDRRGAPFCDEINVTYRGMVTETEDKTIIRIHALLETFRPSMSKGIMISLTILGIGVCLWALILFLSSGRPANTIDIVKFLLSIIFFIAPWPIAYAITSSKEKWQIHRGIKKISQKIK